MEPTPVASRTVTLRCAVGDAEALTGLAWARGATGVAELSDGCEPGSVRLVIGVADAEAAAHLLAALGDDRRSAAVAVADADDTWVDAWRAHATAHRAGRVGIRLVDHPRTDAPVDIVIEPGATFGYGHPTTLLALELLDGIARPLGRVLDVGTGSGVLAIAAALLGAEQVTAIDIDPDAVTTCRANAHRNRAVVDVRRGDARSDPLPSPGRGYDLVLVNVTASVQVALADIVWATAAPDAFVVVSGILAQQEAAVVAAHGTATVIDRLERDGWVALVLGGPRNESDPPGPRAAAGRVENADERAKRGRRPHDQSSRTRPGGDASEACDPRPVPS